MTTDIASQMEMVLDRIEGETIEQKIGHLLVNEFRRRLQECEKEILELEIKYGVIYDRFRSQLQGGELGDPFSYPLEQDTMRWDDLRLEREHWLTQLREIRGVLA